MSNSAVISPIRSNRQEQEWYECKQGAEETIYEFIIRLRALWTEHKPKETEVDLIKHLFRRMNNKSLDMMTSLPRGATLDRIIKEAQEVDQIVYHRKKEERRLKDLNQASTQIGILGVNQSQYKDTIAAHQQTTFNKKNTDRLYPTTNYCKQTPAQIGLEELLKQLKQPFIQRPIEVQRETEKSIQLVTIEQEDSIAEQLTSTIELDEDRSLYSFWPIGTESWYIHEIRPQRIFNHKNFSHSPRLVENISDEIQPEVPESISDFQTVISSNEIVPQIDEVHNLQSHKIIELDVHQLTSAEKSSQNTETSSQLLCALPLDNEQQQTHLEPLEITNIRCKPKLRFGRHHTNRKPGLHDLLSISKERFTKYLPYVKTIKILRDLESLLFYAIL
ncbi:unnamed protein product [Adineta steineri]|uniref:Uncharacterized protein n=1 Tax=Adineta steineri TaxID=433720 RepID=A0A815UWJ1_9BILA|nr:unnamed protein product [Adineta steineri]CAF4237694.1 unnamed protein product [Adineta steineri]